MRTSEFKAYYKRAKQVKVTEDPGFLSAGYFWMDLTTKQQQMMINLMASQGAEVKDGGISLANGLKVMGTPEER